MDIEREDCPYTKYFCEENIWHIARALTDRGMPPRKAQVLLFTNPTQSAALAEQHAAGPGQILAWDYHVVLRVRDDDADRIYDPDSRLPFPCDTDRYLRATFGNQARLPARFRTYVRIIPAAAYLAEFASDRSHMRGRLPAERFPGYQCIQPPAGSRRVDLAAYRDLARDLGDASRVMPVAALIDAGGP